MKLITSILTVLILSSNDTPKIWENAKASNQNILLYFSGSDWCHNCIKLHQTVIKNKEFKTSILDQVVFYNADFPQKNNQNKDLIKFNESLADRYNSTGIFPLLVLVDQDKKELSHTTYIGGNIKDYTSIFLNYIND